MRIIGVTGGICSGKSTVTRVLASLGVSVLDADKLGHRAYEKGSDCFQKLVEHFGTKIIGSDGEINRQLLGSIVFSDISKMNELKTIVWPEIRRLIIEELKVLENQGIENVVLEAAVMIEAGWQDLVSTLWVVSVDRETAKTRLMARNSLSESDALKRIDSQISNEERCKYASVVIDNSSIDKPMSEFEDEIRKLYSQ